MTESPGCPCQFLGEGPKGSKLDNVSIDVLTHSSHSWYYKDKTREAHSVIAIHGFFGNNMSHRCLSSRNVKEGCHLCKPRAWPMNGEPFVAGVEGEVLR